MFTIVLKYHDFASNYSVEELIKLVYLSRHYTPKNIKNKKVIILGDLSINFPNPNIDPNLETVMNSDSLQAVDGEPVRIGTNSQTIIDQIILNIAFWESNCQVIDTGFSDYYAKILELHNIKQENNI